MATYITANRIALVDGVDCNYGNYNAAIVRGSHGSLAITLAEKRNRLLCMLVGHDPRGKKKS